MNVMSHRTNIAAIALLASLWGATTGVHAQPIDIREHPALYLQGGLAERSAQSLTLGATAPMQWRTVWADYPVTAHWDMSLSMWNAKRPNSDSSRTIAVLGISPSLRLHSKSATPWFVEAGLGGYLYNQLYQSHNKRFSTAFNFGTRLGIGFFSGLQRENEWMLRVEHFSNASIKKPNPGENFIQLRYARHF